jgi:hypothetical protein
MTGTARRTASRAARGHGFPPARLALIAAMAACTTITACGPARPAASGTTAAPASPAVSHSAAPASGLALLPVPPGSLAGAASLAARFAASYASYSYAQPAASYLARLRPMVTSTLYNALASAAQAPGLQAQRERSRLAVSAHAEPQSIRDIQPGAVIVVVRVWQQASSSTGTTQSTADYAVTVVTRDSTWSVYDIEPASAGNGGAPG